MATLRSDIIIPEVFTPYVIEQTTQRDAFLASGVVQPMAELNATEGGDFINVPFWKANLSGDFEVLSDSSSLTPGKITADKQVGVILHRGRAFEARDLAALAAGSDPMAAIGCIDSESGDTPTALSPRHVAQARAILGDQGDKLAAVAMHSKVYYDLVERRAIDYVTAGEARQTALGTAEDAFGGSIQNAFGNVSVPTFMGLRVIVSDDVNVTGSGSSTEYATYFFTQGAVASGEQMAMQTETDRDILAKSDAMSIDLHYVYHPVGSRFSTSVTNPTRAQLETVGNCVRATNVSNFD
jgi:hypothetical protein